MPFEHLAVRLAVALAIGLLIGLERGWHARNEAEGGRAAGFRTFAISGLFGGICGALVPSAGAALLAAGLVALTTVFTVFRWLEAQVDRDFSATGIVAAMATYVLGAYAVLGDVRIAAGSAVVVTLLLALKQPLHAWVRNLTWEEIRAGLILLAMSFLLLPILPDRTIDPWQAVNPAEIWLLAIIIAALSFVGYIAVKAIGDRAGIVLVSLAGGLASSTAVTMTLARLSRDGGGGRGSDLMLAGGVLLAAAVMVARVFFIAVLFNQSLAYSLAWPLAAAAAVFLVAAGLLFWRSAGAAGRSSALTLRNPLDLAVALKLAGFIAVITLVSKIAVGALGDAGAYVVAAISGIADVDALTLSMSRMAGSGIAVEAAATGIAIAAGVNTISKCVMAAAVGSRGLAIAASAVSAIALIAGAIAWVFVR